MIYIETYEGLFSFLGDRYVNKSKIGEWETVVVDGIDLNIQPGISVKKSIVDSALRKISKLSKKWNLVSTSRFRHSYIEAPTNKSDIPIGSVDLFTRCQAGHFYSLGNYRKFMWAINYQDGKDISLKFRLSDTKGDSEYGTDLGYIPIDIFEDIVSDVENEFGKDRVVNDSFDARGYILFTIKLK